MNRPPKTRVETRADERSMHVLLVMSAQHHKQLPSDEFGQGVRVIAAESCEEARAEIRTRRNLDAVIADLTLEDGNWWSVYLALVLRGLDIPLIVALPSEAGKEGSVLDCGADGVVRPPFEASRVLSLIRAPDRSEGAVPQGRLDSSVRKESSKQLERVCA